MRNPRRRYYILTEDHEPVLVDETTWENWPGRNLDLDLVGFTQINDEVEVRTQFHGVDDGYFPGRPPALFETEVLRPVLCGWTRIPLLHLGGS
jgi:hypothetical protein